MSETAQPTPLEPPRGNSPFVQPIRPASVPVERSQAELQEARLHQEKTPQQRFEERDGPVKGERLGDRKLSDAEYEALPMSARAEYARCYTEKHAEGGDAQRPDPARAAEGEKPAPASDGEKHRFGDLELTAKEISDIVARQAADDSRRLTLPSDPSGYTLDLPKDFVLPEGIEVKFDPNSPDIHLARQFAKNAELTQEQFSQLLSIAGAMQVRQASTFKAARDAEVAKLGATGSQRVTAIQTFLRGHLGDTIARPFITTLVTEAQVRGWEKLIQKVTTGGLSSFSHAGRNSGERPAMDDATWNNMNYSQQKE